MIVLSVSFHFTCNYFYELLALWLIMAWSTYMVSWSEFAEYAIGSNIIFCCCIPPSLSRSSKIEVNAKPLCTMLSLRCTEGLWHLDYLTGSFSRISFSMHSGLTSITLETSPFPLPWRRPLGICGVVHLVLTETPSAGPHQYCLEPGLDLPWRLSLLLVRIVGGVTKWSFVFHSTMRLSPGWLTVSNNSSN